jgi:hypothetical protein
MAMQWCQAALVPPSGDRYVERTCTLGWPGDADVRAPACRSSLGRSIGGGLSPAGGSWRPTFLPGDSQRTVTRNGSGARGLRRALSG